MNVAFVSLYLSRKNGGIFEAERQLAGALLAKQVNVSALGLRDELTANDREAWNIVNRKAFKSVGPSSLGFSRDLARDLKTGGYDILHSHGLWTLLSYSVQRSGSSCSLPYLVSPHGMLDPWALRNSRWKKVIAGWLYERKHLQAASCLHAVSIAEAEAIRSYGLRNPVCVIPNAVDLPEKPLSDSCVPWRDSVPRGAKVLLFLSRIHPKKGLAALIRAWGNIRADGAADDWHLVIVGWDQAGHEAELKTLTSHLGLQSSVSFPGSLFGDDREAAYQTADAFILPSHGEGLPLAVLEAWAHELPVVMTPQCNIPEGFQANAAISAEPNESSIVEALCKLFEMTEDERKAMGCRGFELVREKFTWQKAAADMKSVYEWVLGEGKKPDCVMTD